MKRAYSYLRFSEPRQQWGDSERRQAKLTDDYCTRKGLFLDESLQLRDRGKSAFHGDNLATLAAFLEEVKAKRVPKGSFLIIENLDRLSREQTLKAFGLFSDILQSGIVIVTLSPEREYSYETVNQNVGLIMEAVLSLFLGHEESRKKSERVQAEWRERLTKLHEVKATARCPAWLSLRKDRKAYVERPEAAKIVRQIFRWAIEGYGVATITKKLNRAGVKSIGGRQDSSSWHESYVRLILTNRAVLGEYQSYTGKGSKAKPFGPVVPDYYPQVISEGDFYAAQKQLKSRTTQRGPRGKCVANLFTGLLIDARDKAPLNIVAKRKHPKYDFRTGGRVLISSKAIRGVRGSVYKSFPYQLVEDAILSFLREVKASELTPREESDAEDATAAASGRVAELAHQMSVLKDGIKKHRDSEALVDLLAEAEKEWRAAVAQLEAAKESKAAGSAETVGEVTSLVKLLADAREEEREPLRTRLKAKLRLIVSEIWCFFADAPIVGSRGRVGKGRVACVQLHFKNGHSRTIMVSTLLRRAGKVEDITAWGDFRKGYKWFEKLLAETIAATPAELAKGGRYDPQDFAEL